MHIDSQTFSQQPLQQDSEQSCGKMLAKIERRKLYLLERGIIEK